MVTILINSDTGQVVISNDGAGSIHYPPKTAQELEYLIREILQTVDPIFVKFFRVDKKDNRLLLGEW